MSTSIIHVLTVMGSAAEEVEAACEELLQRRVECAPSGFGSLNWSEQDHKDIEKLCATLIDAAHRLPVLYYAQYLDSWTVADSSFWLLQWPDGKRRHVCGDLFSFVYYPSRFCSDFLAQIKKLRRRKLYRTQVEDRWFLDHVYEAAQSALSWQAPFLVVAISQCLGPSRHDEEIKAALKEPM